MNAGGAFDPRTMKLEGMPRDTAGATIEVCLFPGLIERKELDDVLAKRKERIILHAVVALSHQPATSSLSRGRSLEPPTTAAWSTTPDN